MRLLKSQRGIIFLLILITITWSTQKNKPVVTFITIVPDLTTIEAKITLNDNLNHFKNLLKIPSNLIVFGSQQMKKIVKENRNHPKTLFLQIQKANFTKGWQYPLVEKNYADYLQMRRNTINISQAIIFNATNGSSAKQQNTPFQIVFNMSKMPFINYALKQDPFNSDFFFWIDPLVTKMIPQNFLLKNNFFERFQLFMQQPFHTHRLNDLNFEVLSYQSTSRYVKKNLDAANYSTQSYFGGRADSFPTIGKVYQNFARIVLQNKDLEAIPHIFTLMRYRYPLLLTSFWYKYDLFNNIIINYKIFLQPHQQRKYNIQLDGIQKLSTSIFWITDEQNEAVATQLKFDKTVLLKRLAVLLISVILYVWYCAMSRRIRAQDLAAQQQKKVSKIKESSRQLNVHEQTKEDI